MNELFESDAFCTGVSVGISIFQQKVVDAHKRKEPLNIGGTMYYLKDGRERLKEEIERLCK